MKNAIIVHGMPPKEEYYNPDSAAGGNFHWLPWLQKQLIIRDIKADNPSIPHSYAPTYENYCREFERFDITPETILVGHSNGAGFLVKWLSEHKDVKVGKVVLVAPWMDPEGELESGMYKDVYIDTDLVSRTKGVVIFHGDNDEEDIQVTVAELLESVRNIQYREFSGYGHFIPSDMPSPEFHELLEEILK